MTVTGIQPEDSDFVDYTSPQWGQSGQSQLTKTMKGNLSDAQLRTMGISDEDINSPWSPPAAGSDKLEDGSWAPYWEDAAGNRTYEQPNLFGVAREAWIGLNQPTEEDIVEALEVVNQRQNTLTHRQLNQDPLVSEHDTGTSLTAEGVNTVVSAAINEVNGSGDESVKEALELLAVVPDPNNPSQVVMPALEDSDLAQELGITEAPNGFVPFEPLSDEKRKEILSEVANTKSWTYEDFNKERLEDIIKTSSNKEARDAAAWSLVIKHGWTPENFEALGVPISNLAISNFTDNQWNAYKMTRERIDNVVDLGEYMNFSPEMKAAHMKSVYQDFQIAQNTVISVETLTLDGLKRGGVKSFNIRYGTDYKTWDGLTRAFANKTMTIGQANTYMLLWGTAKQLDSTSKSNASANADADKVTESTILTSLGKTATTDNNLILQAWTGNIDPNVWKAIRMDPTNQANEIFDRAVLLPWQDPKSPHQRVIWGLVQKSLGPNSTEEERLAEYKKYMNPMSYIANGRNFFDRPEWASFSGYQLGKNYSAMVGTSKSAHLNKLVRLAMLGIEKWKQGGLKDPKTEGYLHFITGLYLGGQESGDEDILEDLFKGAGLTVEGSFVTELFLAHAQEAWGPLMGGDDIENMKDMIKIIEERFMGLLSTVTMVASASNIDEMGLATGVRNDIRDIKKNIFPLTEGSWFSSNQLEQVISPEVSIDTDTRIAMGATSLDELYRTFINIGLFTPEVTKNTTRLQEELWKAYGPTFSPFLTEELQNLEVGEKLAYGFRMIMSDRVIARAFRNSLYATAIHNGTDGSGNKMNAYDTASMLNVFLAREGFTILPMQLDSGGNHIIPQVVATGPNWTGTDTWLQPTKPNEDARKTNGDVWNNSLAELLDSGAPPREVQKRITGILIRNYTNEEVGLEEEVIRGIAAEVYQERVIRDTKYTPTLTDLLFAMAVKIQDKGLAAEKEIVMGIAEWGKQRLEQAASQGLETWIIPQRNELAGTALGVRGNPHIRIRQLTKEVDKQGGFFAMFSSRDRLYSIYDIPWWQIHDEDMAGLKDSKSLRDLEALEFMPATRERMLLGY